MAIRKNDVITKNDVFEYLINKDYEQLHHVKVYGDAFVTRNARESGYFWIRNTPELFETPTYSSGTTYAIKYRSLYDSVVYESLQNGNINHQPDISPTYWRAIPGGVVKTTYNNCTLFGGRGPQVDYSNDDEWRLRLWKVTWVDVVEQLELIFDEDEGGKPRNYSVELSIDPGYYKYELYVSARGASSDTTATISAKRYANDFEVGKVIRLFSSDYKELLLVGQDFITPTIGASGRMTTADYVGGDYFGV